MYGGVSRGESKGKVPDVAGGKVLTVVFAGSGAPSWWGW